MENARGGRVGRRNLKEISFCVKVFPRNAFSSRAPAFISRAFYSRGGSERIPIRRRSWIFDARIERASCFRSNLTEKDARFAIDRCRHRKHRDVKTSFRDRGFLDPER